MNIESRWMMTLMEQAAQLRQAELPPASMPGKIKKAIILLLDDIFAKLSSAYQQRRNQLTNRFEKIKRDSLHPSSPTAKAHTLYQDQKDLSQPKSQPIQREDEAIATIRTLLNDHLNEEDIVLTMQDSGLTEKRCRELIAQLTKEPTQLGTKPGGEQPSSPTAKAHALYQDQKDFSQPKNQSIQREDEAIATIRTLLNDHLNEEDIVLTMQDSGLTEKRCRELIARLKKEPTQLGTKLGNEQPSNIEKNQNNMSQSLPGIHYEGLPGEWYQMTTSQVKEGATNGCTTIALFTLNAFLAQPSTFTPQLFNEWIKEGSKRHLTRYGTAPLNRFVREVIEDLQLDRLHVAAELTYDPHLADVLEKAPQTPEELTAQLIQRADGKSFTATLSDGRETIALLYKNAKEMYILDAHQKRFDTASRQILLDTAYIVKFKTKDELDAFLFKHRYFFDEQAQRDIEEAWDEDPLYSVNRTVNGANQIDAILFQ